MRISSFFWTFLRVSTYNASSVFLKALSVTRWCPNEHLNYIYIFPWEGGLKGGKGFRLSLQYFFNLLAFGSQNSWQMNPTNCFGVIFLENINYVIFFWLSLNSVFIMASVQDEFLHYSPQPLQLRSIIIYRLISKYSWNSLRTLLTGEILSYWLHV